jgi:hypothetical protein
MSYSTTKDIFRYKNDTWGAIKRVIDALRLLGFKKMKGQKTKANKIIFHFSCKQ